MDKVLLVTWGNGDKECYVGRKAEHDLQAAMNDLELFLAFVSIHEFQIMNAMGQCLGKAETLVAMNVSAD